MKTSEEAKREKILAHTLLGQLVSVSFIDGPTMRSKTRRKREKERKKKAEFAPVPNEIANNTRGHARLRDDSNHEDVALKSRCESEGSLLEIESNKNKAKRQVNRQ